MKQRAEAYRKQQKEISQRKFNKKSKIVLSVASIPGKKEQLLAAQFYKCAICDEDTSAKERGSKIDKDDETGIVRGVICHTCNVGMRSFEYDIELLKSAIEHLERYQIKVGPAKVSIKMVVHESWLKPIESKPFDKFNWWQYIPEIMQFDVDML